MELRHLRYFATAAAEGSLHSAAARLNIAQPALSRQIRDLETELGVLLFIRSVEGVKLTVAGETLLTDVKRLLPQIEHAKTRAKRAGSKQLGTLRIGVTLMAAEVRFAMAAFADARRLLPDVDFRLSLINSDQQADAFSRDDIDIGLLYLRGSPPSGMSYRDLRIDKYLLGVPEGHRLCKRTNIKLKDLQNEDMLFMAQSLRPAAYDEMMSEFLRGGLTPRVAHEVDNESTMINMIGEGIAVGFCLSSLTERRVARGVAFLPVEDFNVRAYLCAMWKRDRETSVLRQYVDLLVKHEAAASKRTAGN
jgi:DNA-binding transcriptional LysR family regulator